MKFSERNWLEYFSEKLTGLNVSPLDGVPVGVIKVFKLVVDIRLPSDTGVVDVLWVVLSVEQFESVVEERLGDETARVGWLRAH
jgi:hypothetical protein